MIVSNSEDTPRPEQPPVEVVMALKEFPNAAREALMKIRALILETASVTDGVGPISEELKWGEPAYLTNETKSGSTIRIGWKPASPDKVAVYFNCNTNLVETFRDVFPVDFTYQGNRAVLIDIAKDPKETPLDSCIAQALTYHLSKRKAKHNR